MDKSRIAIIDDDPELREVLQDLLTAADWRLFFLPGQNLAAAHGDIRPDLVIVAIPRGPVDGIHGPRGFFKENLPAGIPVIIIGRGDEAADKVRGVSADNCYFVDSLNIADKLVPTVRQALEKRVSPQNGRQILVVDDSLSIRLLLQDNLGKLGYRVRTAENGREAMALLEQERPDLILSDVYMPEMNGLELCETLHGDPRFSRIPFVVMSTENDADNMRKMMQFGAAAFIIKPFNLEQLMMTLNKIFSYEFLLLLKENERLNGEQKLLLAGITSLVKALEARDHYTRGHSDRVSRILAGMVKVSGGDRREVERATIAGRLHDIGKIGIRDNILLKTGRLSAEEFDLIKQHPAIGAGIIQNIPSIADIVPVVASHHERVDGRGYPRGLQGNEIPFWARLTAVADTYDALTTDRPYRRGMGHDHAIAVIGDVAGSQLCPDCVRLFLEWNRLETLRLQQPEETRPAAALSPGMFVKF